MRCNEAAAKAQAIQEVEYLRRWYAKATDLIGSADPDAVAEGRAIYHRVFAPDAKLNAGPDRTLVGPDAWVDLVLGALGELGPTQHLIGTQLVEIKTLELDDDCNVTAGSAYMESYVQAWHELKNDKVWLFLGTYFDDAVYIPGTGWRIAVMNLQQVAGEIRFMGDAVGGTDAS
ncbi:MAG: nuclear transport factor 2 family protein [Halioglobus sp.]